MLKGKRAIITGSTSGIGKGIAEALAAAGAHIMLNGFGEAKATEQLRADMAQRFGVTVAYSDADMSKPEEIAAMIAQADQVLGGADILVNNAGVQHTAPIPAFPTAKWDQLIAILLSSAFHTMRLVLPHMMARGWGRVINIASAHGCVASKEKSAYVAAKHGLLGLTKVGALEQAGTGVTVNAICPGWVLTPLVQAQIDALAMREGLPPAEAAKSLLAEKQPSGGFVTPEQIGAMACYLCDDAAAQITGAAISIDGGWTAQ